MLALSVWRVSIGCLSWCCTGQKFAHIEHSEHETNSVMSNLTGYGQVIPSSGIVGSKLYTVVFAVFRRGTSVKEERYEASSALANP